MSSEETLSVIALGLCVIGIAGLAFWLGVKGIDRAFRDGMK